MKNEPVDRGMWADVSLDHKYRAKRSDQTPAEYASAITGFRRPTSVKTRLGYAVALLLALGAIYLLGVK
jgi:hypothetical protein